MSELTGAGLCVYCVVLNLFVWFCFGSNANVWQTIISRRTMKQRHAFGVAERSSLWLCLCEFFCFVFEEDILCCNAGMFVDSFGLVVNLLPTYKEHRDRPEGE